ncbi:MAG: response regulator [Candidatus Omnitrophota bacterium]|nr:response regulator [Candidatus Omnitrophota bacterium]
MGKKILMIDDEINFCKLVKMNLESTGDFTVETVSDGKEGIKLAKKIKPDLILLDVMMPGISGIEVLERLKKDRDTVAIPVAMLSIKRDEFIKFEAAQLYDEDYITKPIDAPSLKAKIEEILKRRGVW